ncbi:universal stress protein [Zoogloea sp.]|jgi:nucleotide-binding universal stress UspA family protein|uniref:universal stress protein n=1 Tax=Zoogloea sp. TaxID=49181 RepID=UPI00258E81F5|nr:universal stress protein [Zoogloea sp.]MDD2668219.1 universal stress protein [Zoogloea sp.]
MTRILFPVDGSDLSVQVAGALPARLAVYQGPVEIHLLNVQRPVHRDVGQFLAHDGLQALHREEGLKALAAEQAALEAAGLVPLLHVVVDDQPAEAIVRFAREHGFDQIVMGSHGRGALASLLLDSVSAEVIRLADIPVTLIK